MASEWRPSTWGDEVTLEYGKAIRGYSQTCGKYRVFGSNGPIGWTSEALTQGPGVVLGRKGAYRGVEFWRDPFWVIDTAYYVVPKADLDMCWLYYAIKHYKLGEVDDGSPIPSTTRAAVYMLELDVPPRTEQRAIAHILGTLDDKIELNRRMNETLEAMARALFKAWFVDFFPVRAKMEGRWKRGESLPGLPAHLFDLFPDQLIESEFGEIPEGWIVTSVDNEFDVTMGQSPPGNTYNETGEGLPFYQGRTDFAFRFPKRRIFCTAPTRLAKAGDTLVSVRAPVGDINMASENCAIGRGIAAVRHKTGNRSFTYQFMRSISDVFARFDAEGTVFGSIGKKDFHSIAHIKPSRDLVSAYEKLADPFDNRIERNECESQILAQLRDTLLPKLISGELRVRDAERIVEVAL